ncbi:MAG TPA: hypothetical protein VJH68_04200, partial [Candidatus Nanoarchaeia archaeon]|nr:hypothetical protein [Candidatus Nanoarchaeia archaeon]
MAKPRKIRANLFLFLTVLLLGLVLIEICLRIFSPLPVGYPRGTFKVDSELGYAFTEDFSSEIIEPEFKTKINTNSFSFRDSE